MHVRAFRRSAPGRVLAVRESFEDVAGGRTLGEVFLETRNPFEPGTRVEIALRAPKFGRVRAVGIVRWANWIRVIGRPVGMGVELRAVYRGAKP
jgi:hypothetical protein